MEVRGTSVEVRLEELRRAVEAAPRDSEPLCEAVLMGMVGPDEPRDDVALLALRVAPLPTRGLTLELPAEPEALSSARKALDRWLSEAGMSRTDVHAIKVASGEACANAMERAFAQGDAAFRIEARRRDAGC